MRYDIRKTTTAKDDDKQYDTTEHDKQVKDKKGDTAPYNKIQ
jgi:hypothetical protein